MRRHLAVVGPGLAGIGLTGILAYMIGTIADGTHNPPAWPYLACAGIMVAGILAYLLGYARSTAKPKHAGSRNASSAPGSPASVKESSASGQTQDQNAAGRKKRISARLLLAASGVLLIVLGLWAILTLKGRPQALLSALIAVGVVLILMAIFRFKRSAITVELILGIAGVITLPYAVWTLGDQGSTATAAACTNGNYANQPVPIKWVPYKTDNYSRFTTIGDIHTAYYPDLRWAGYYVPLPNQLCSYTVSFFAREVGPANTPVAGDGWGYASGVCDMAQVSEPVGFSLQYAFFQENAQQKVGAFEVVHLPQANTFPNNISQGYPYPLDYNWHQWTLKVANNQVSVYFDDDYKVAQENLTGSGLPNDCSSSGVFFRIWGGSAQFHDLSVTPNS